ncbi:Intraflagellar transport protein 52 [Cichlidogyrus casuarinus]|uniref:Intraflagellar transport protein 52 n=1 Tax=Cichlidogyrus casuarinus TaxID=1844966 RepID=A0ABD2Q9P4_9PLAT
MFTDKYIGKEENAKIFHILLEFLTESSSVQLDDIDAVDPDMDEYIQVPNIPLLAESIKCCLQESEEVPNNVTGLFDNSLFKLDTSLVIGALDAYKKLRVKHEPLSLIPPQLETTLPPLELCVLPPDFRDLNAPALELFDLDEQFCTTKSKLAQVTNKCNENDLEYYVRECGDVLGIIEKLPPTKVCGKAIMEMIVKELCRFKSCNDEQGQSGAW